MVLFISFFDRLCRDQFRIALQQIQRFQQFRQRCTQRRVLQAEGSCAQPKSFPLRGARSRALAVREAARQKRGSNREQKKANSDALRPCETIAVVGGSRRLRGCSCARAVYNPRKAKRFSACTPHPPNGTFPIKGKAFGDIAVTLNLLPPTSYLLPSS